MIRKISFTLLITCTSKNFSRIINSPKQKIQIMKQLRNILSILLLSSVFFCFSCSEKEKDPPNILFILTDDQSPFTLKAYGNEVCETPNLDRLSEQGMTFDGAYHMGSYLGAVCAPSRTMMITGRSLWRTGWNTRGLGELRPGNNYVHEPEKWWAQLTEDHPAFYSMPAVFKRAGYKTFRTCKGGNYYEDACRLFDERYDKGNYGKDDEGSKWHADRVLDYLNKRASLDEKEPFLIFFGFTHPHDPRYGEPELLEKYGAVNENIPTEPNPKAPPLQANYLPAHPFPHGHPGLRDEEHVQGVMTRRDEATIRNEQGREYACIENIDIQIGRVLKKLEDMGELENTYVIYTADHGISVGRHGLTGKQNLYEHTWRVPFIVTGPGIKPGSRAQGNIYLMDILQTMCDLAGIPQSETMNGISFKPVLMGEKETVRDVMYGVYCGGTKPGMRSVKKGDWKLIKYDVLDGEVRETQLFNLAENPNEFLIEHHDPKVVALTGVVPEPHQVNLADDPAYADKFKEMEELLLEQMNAWGDPYRLWDQPPIGN